MKIERCGFCGRYFKGEKLLTEEQVKQLSQEELNCSLGYCPEANYEAYLEENSEPRYVIRNMAIDAGDMSLEGQRY